MEHAERGPGVSELPQEDTDWWRAKFAEDRLHPGRIMLAQYATEGIIGTSYRDKALTPAVLAQAKATIFGLTETNGPVVRRYPRPGTEPRYC